MATTLPTYTRTIDQFFVSTWYEIKAEAVDNILNATIITAALKELGSFTPQVGGEFITETIAHGEKSATAVGKGDVLPSGEDDLDTLAMWTWRYTVAHIQRSLFDDQKNAGPSKIKSLVKRKMQAARQALEQQIEVDFLRGVVTAETGKFPQGLYDIIPVSGSRSTGTYGKINRPTAYSSGVPSTGNVWWGANYKQWTAPAEINMLTDMANLYNTCTKGISSPKLILTDQTKFELYETYAEDKTQIIKDESTNLANLGYGVLRYKGKPLVWSDQLASGGGTAGDMLMLNTDFISVVYDPNLWFDMTEFKAMPKQAERLAHIFVAWNMTSSQLRRHGLLYT